MFLIKYLKLGACVLCLLHPLITFANNTPNSGVLYRVDTRSPNEIFNTGFTPFGDNDNVRDHSRGG